MAINVKTFFAVFLAEKILIYQSDSGLCAEIAWLRFHKRRSRGKSANRKILCLHTLSTLCSIDFELRHTFSPLPLSPPNLPARRVARVEMQLKRPNFPNHAREFDSQEIYHLIFLFYL